MRSLLASMFMATSAFCAVDDFEYQMPMPRAPDTVAEATLTLSDRQRSVMAAIACGSEFSCVSHYLGKANNEDIAAEILGKLAWYQRSRQFSISHASPPEPCVLR